MRHNRAHEVEKEASTRCDSRRRPEHSDYQSQCSGKLQSSQNRQALQRHANRIVDHPHLTRITTNLSDAGKQSHQRQERGNHSVCSIHRVAIIVRCIAVANNYHIYFYFNISVVVITSLLYARVQRLLPTKKSKRGANCPRTERSITSSASIGAFVAVMKLSLPNVLSSRTVQII